MRMSAEGSHAGNRPPRPALTTTFTCACLFWATCAASYASGRVFDAQACMTGSIVAVSAGLGMTAIVLVTRKHALAAGVMALCLGAALGCAIAAGNHLDAQAFENGQVVQAEVTFDGDSKPTSSGESAFVRIRLPDSFETTAYADLGDGTTALHGEKAKVTGTWKTPDWNRDEYLWQNGATGRIVVSEMTEVHDETPLGYLRAARRKAIEVLQGDDDGHALLQAVVCGYRRSITSTAVYAWFQTCGLAHLVAVSGTHLVIVTGLFAVVLKAAQASRRLSTAVLMVVMGSYLVFSGAPVSAIRATIMTSIGLASIFGNRRPSTLNALGIGLFAILISSPQSSVSVSLALSALSTMGIVLFSPLFGFWFRMLPLARIPVIADTLSMTCAANVLSQPFACSVFGMLPLIGPLANVACAPVFPIVCACGLIAAFMGVAGLPGWQAVGGLASSLAGLFGKAVGMVAGVPYASIPVSIESLAAIALSAAMAVCLWLLWSKISLKHLAAVVACIIPLFVSVSAMAAQGDAIVMLDVGQGDSFLVRSRGSTLLIDTGNKDSQLISQLAKCHVLKLDAVLLTHSDDDHTGSLDALERAMHVDRALVMADLAASTDGKNMQLLEQAGRTADSVVGVKAGDTFAVGAFTAHVIWPHGFSDEGGNADSVCVLLDYDGNDDGTVDFRALFTGDAEEEQIAAILETTHVGDIDILKVGHHGSAGGMSQEQLNMLKPKIALIGVGAGNRYGHPAQETLDMLDSAGCKVYRSDLDGQVACSLSADAIRVRLQ